MMYLLVGLLTFIAGFIVGVTSLYLRFNVGTLVVVDDGDEPYTYAEFEKPIEVILNKHAVVLDVKKVNFIDHTR